MKSKLNAYNQIIGQIRKIPEEVRTQVVPEWAKATRAHIAQSVQAEQDPYGKPWAKRKSGTGKLLPNAMQHVSVKQHDDAVWVSVNGWESRHHTGAVRGGEKRGIIPTYKQGVPAKLMAEMDQIVQRWMDRGKDIPEAAE
jgi:hypothetical protein